MRSSLLAKVQHEAVGAGLNLLGLVDAARFDSCQPKEQRTSRLVTKCGTIVVLGSGGRAFWQQPALTDASVRVAVRGIEATLASAAVASRAFASCRPGQLSFARLGEAAGFGSISPVSGFLVHPHFGPWIGIRAVVLVDGHPFGPIVDASITDRFHPCCGCSRPCVDACPGDAHSAGNCNTSCLRRTACPVGAEHRAVARETARPACAAPSMPQIGAPFVWGVSFVWRFVPKFFRRGPQA